MDLPRLCAECLLENANFRGYGICPSGFVPNVAGTACLLADCPDGICTLNGCMYPVNDPYSAECYPRDDCELELRPITECAGFCS